jgi:hypothetical protein
MKVLLLLFLCSLWGVQGFVCNQGSSIKSTPVGSSFGVCRQWPMNLELSQTATFTKNDVAPSVHIEPPQPSKSTHRKQRRPLLSRLFQPWRKYLPRRLPQRIRYWMLALYIIFACQFHSAIAVTSGGRMGGGTISGSGSHSSSSGGSSATTRVLPSRSYSYSSRPDTFRISSTRLYGRPRQLHYYNCWWKPGGWTYGWNYQIPVSSPIVVAHRSSVGTVRDIAVLVGLTSLFVMNGVSNVRNRRRESLWTSASYSGTTTNVESLTVALSVANRRDPLSILNVLDSIAATADTSTPKGLVNLVTQGKWSLSRVPCTERRPLLFVRSFA